MILKNKAIASIFMILAAHCMLISCSTSGSFKTVKSDVSEIVNYITKIDSDSSLTRVKIIGDCSEEALLKNPSCGFETTKFFKTSSKLLCRINHKEYGDSTMNHSFYFRKNKVVYAKVEKGFMANEESVLVYKSEIFLKNNEVIEESRMNKKLSLVQLKQIAVAYLKAHKQLYPNP